MSDAGEELRVSLPGRLRESVDRQVSAGGYESADEFVRAAIREKLLRERGRAELGEALIEGLESGEGIPFDEDFIAQKKRAIDPGASGAA